MLLTVSVKSELHQSLLEQQPDADLRSMASEPQLISLTTILSLLAVLAILVTAYALSVRLLPRSASTKIRVFFIWHLFDALIHFCLEGSYLYNCFFSSAPLSTLTGLSASGLFPTAMTPPEAFFLGKSDVLHGAFYGTSPTARLWQEYAKADRRWGGSDLTVISLELLTVFLMGPLAIYVCHLLRRRENPRAMWWMTVIAVSELYGGE